MPQAGFSTRSVHLTNQIDPHTHAMEVPIVLNTAFAYKDLESWLRVALHQEPGHIYSRNSNPTCRHFEEVMADLEGTEAATSFSTGMAAISSTLLALLSPGQRVVSIKDSYGATYLHFTQILPRFQIRCDVLDSEDHEGIEAAIAQGCDLVYLESPTNPTLKVLDLRRICAAAARVGAVTVVDNTFATPINQNPAALGADLVIHSATKFICGHNDALGGVVCGSRELVGQVYRYRELTGSALDPFSAYLLIRSIKTLALRVRQQNENALQVARYLERHPAVSRVYYPGLPHHPNHDLATRQMRGFGGVLSFDLKGGMETIEQVLPRLRHAYMAANLGQVATIVGPPAATSHVECTQEERAAAGIPEGLVRYAVGIEDVEDLIADLEQALS
ncbi:MAG: aminotransferase class I/II-fold pyridoxal phosphate-dependent enzyme [Anaerolineae bacterium]|nr:aminotransferase class I/II-fold pyridoxal phosphate-dependent enzyme [Anaerolineae bacterium]